MGRLCNIATFCYIALISQLYIGLDTQNFERKIVNAFLPISFNICFGRSKEPSH